jgi:hypothetical protein
MATGYRNLITCGLCAKLKIKCDKQVSCPHSTLKEAHAENLALKFSLVRLHVLAANTEVFLVRYDICAAQEVQNTKRLVL